MHTVIRYRALAASVALLILIGVLGGAFAQTSNSTSAATGIDFRRTETLAWSIELDSGSPDALHDVKCAHVRADRYECVGNDATGKKRTSPIRVSDSGGSWQTIDASDR